MTRRIFSAILLVTGLLLLFILPVSGQAGQEDTPLRVRVFPHRIAIDTGYKGASLFLFGVAPPNSDIVLRVAGPTLPTKVSRQGHVAGLLWMPVEQVETSGIPSFYAVLSSAPLDDILTVPDQRRLSLDPKNIGLRRQIVLHRVADKEQLTGDSFDTYVNDILKVERSKRFYLWNEKAVSITGQDFEAVLWLPPDAPTGAFDIEVIAIRNKEVIYTNHATLMVEKSGLVETLAQQAQTQPLLTGILAVLLPAIAGLGVAGLFGIRGGR
ncbi:MAG: hypothetical protein GXP41_06585 [Chloroflexi bacterium]|nr:hypothetical protein [Chloroflexota bacterium]